MMTSATILHEAQVELWDAVAHYENKAPGLGVDFEAEVERSVQAIRQSRAHGTSADLFRADPKRRLIRLSF